MTYLTQIHLHPCMYCVALQVDTCVLISTCQLAYHYGETRETMTWMLPSLCSETLRLESWVRRLLPGDSQRPPVAVHSWNISSRRRGPSWEQHSHRLCLLLSIPALRADGAEYPEGWEQKAFFNILMRIVSILLHERCFIRHFLSLQVCSKTADWRWEWSRVSLNGPSGSLGTLCLRGFLPLSLLPLISVSTQPTGDWLSSSLQDFVCDILYNFFLVIYNRFVFIQTWAIRGIGRQTDYCH